MGNDHHGAVARRGERAGRLMVGDDVLREPRAAHARERRLAHAFERKQHAAGKREQKPHHADNPADAHEHCTHKDRDAEHGVHHLLGPGCAELLHLGLKAVLAEDLRQILGGQTLLFAASGRDTRALEQVVDIRADVCHRGLRIAGLQGHPRPRARAWFVYSRKYTAS